MNPCRNQSILVSGLQAGFTLFACMATVTTTLIGAPLPPGGVETETGVEITSDADPGAYVLIPKGAEFLDEKRARTKAEFTNVPILEVTQTYRDVVMVNAGTTWPTNNLSPAVKEERPDRLLGQVKSFEKQGEAWTCQLSVLPCPEMEIVHGDSWITTIQKVHAPSRAVTMLSGSSNADNFSKVLIPGLQVGLEMKKGDILALNIGNEELRESPLRGVAVREEDGRKGFRFVTITREGTTPELAFPPDRIRGFPDNDFAAISKLGGTGDPGTGEGWWIELRGGSILSCLFIPVSLGEGLGGEGAIAMESIQNAPTFAEALGATALPKLGIAAPPSREWKGLTRSTIGVIPEAQIQSLHGQITSRWDHNGSEMAMITRGNRTVIAYLRARPALSGLVSQNDILFEGTLSGGKFEGQAYTFKREFLPLAFPARGHMSSDGRSIELNGSAPKRDAEGEIVSHAEETLRFSLKPQGIPGQSLVA